MADLGRPQFTADIRYVTAWCDTELDVLSDVLNANDPGHEYRLVTISAILLPGYDGSDHAAYMAVWERRTP